MSLKEKQRVSATRTSRDTLFDECGIVTFDAKVRVSDLSTTAQTAIARAIDHAAKLRDKFYVSLQLELRVRFAGGLRDAREAVEQRFQSTLGSDRFGQVDSFKIGGMQAASEMLAQQLATDVLNCSVANLPRAFAHMAHSFSMTQLVPLPFSTVEAAATKALGRFVALAEADETDDADPATVWKQRAAKLTIEQQEALKSLDTFLVEKLRECFAALWPTRAADAKPMTLPSTFDVKYSRSNELIDVAALVCLVESIGAMGARLRGEPSSRYAAAPYSGVGCYAKGTMPYAMFTYNDVLGGNAFGQTRFQQLQALVGEARAIDVVQRVRGRRSIDNALQLSATFISNGHDVLFHVRKASKHGRIDAKATNSFANGLRADLAVDPTAQALATQDRLLIGPPDSYKAPFLREAIAQKKLSVSDVWTPAAPATTATTATTRKKPAAVAGAATATTTTADARAVLDNACAGAPVLPGLRADALNYFALVVLRANYTIVGGVATALAATQFSAPIDVKALASADIDVDLAFCADADGAEQRFKAVYDLIGASLAQLQLGERASIESVDFARAGRHVLRRIFVVVDRHQVLHIDATMHAAPTTVLSPVCNVRASLDDGTGAVVLTARVVDSWFANDASAQMLAIRTEIFERKATLRMQNLVDWAGSLTPAPPDVQQAAQKELARRQTKLKERGFNVTVVHVAPTAPCDYVVYRGIADTQPQQAPRDEQQRKASKSRRSTARGGEAAAADDVGFGAPVADKLRGAPVDLLVDSRDLRGHAVFERLLRERLGTGPQSFGTLCNLLRHVVEGADLGQKDWVVLVAGLFRAPGSNMTDEAVIDTARRLLAEKMGVAATDINADTKLAEEHVRAVLEQLDFVWITGEVHGKSMDYGRARVSRGGAEAAERRREEAGTDGARASPRASATFAP